MPKPASRNAPATQPMRTRALARAAASVDVEARTFSAILTTETPVRTSIPDPAGVPDALGAVPHIDVDEVLVTAGLDVSRAERMPLLACHGTWSLADYLGQVTAVRQEAVEGAGNCVVIDAAFKPSQADMAADVAAGYYPNLSAGYVVHAYEVEDREGQVPLARATSWTLLEASIVPVGADPNARMRSAAAQHPLPAVRLRASQNPKTRGLRMDIEDLVAAAEDALEALEEAAERAGDELDEKVEERIRKLRGEDNDETSERKRSKRSKRESDKDAESERKRGKRSDEDEDQRNEDDPEERRRSKREDEELEGVRSLARTYGRDVVKIVDDLSSLGARASEIRAAVRSAVVARAGSGMPSGTVVPSHGQRGGRSDLSHRDAFAGLRGAFKR